MTDNSDELTILIGQLAAVQHDHGIDLTKEIAKAEQCRDVAIKHEAAIRWAMGETNFRERKEGEGPYWWRTELRKISGIDLDTSKWIFDKASQDE